MSLANAESLADSAEALLNQLHPSAPVHGYLDGSATWDSLRQRLGELLLRAREASQNKPTRDVAAKAARMIERSAKMGVLEATGTVQKDLRTIGATAAALAAGVGIAAAGVWLADWWWLIALLYTSAKRRR